MIKKLIGAIALSMLFAAHANAATLSIAGPTSVDEGQDFMIQIFGTGFLGGLGAGGVTLQYDSALVTLNSVTLNLSVDADFSCPGAAGCPPDTAGSAAVVWGDFATGGIIPASDAGIQTLMATISFTAIAPGTEADAFFNMIDNPGLVGGWFNPGINSLIDTPDFVGTSVAVNTAVIPLPAAVWFMIGGLGTLLGFRRK